MKYCDTCGHPENNHPFRHPFVAITGITSLLTPEYPFNYERGMKKVWQLVDEASQRANVTKEDMIYELNKALKMYGFTPRGEVE